MRILMFLISFFIGLLNMVIIYSSSQNKLISTVVFFITTVTIFLFQNTTPKFVSYQNYIIKKYSSTIRSKIPLLFEQYILNCSIGYQKKEYFTDNKIEVRRKIKSEFSSVSYTPENMPSEYYWIDICKEVEVFELFNGEVIECTLISSLRSNDSKITLKRIYP